MICVLNFVVKFNDKRPVFVIIEFMTGLHVRKVVDKLLRQKLQLLMKNVLPDVTNKGNRIFHYGKINTKI